MTDPNISWQRTFPESEPGTDGVAVFEGRIIGRIMHMTNLPRDPKPWLWSITDPDLAGRPGWANTHGEMPSRRQAMDRLIERWQELRRLSEGCGGPRPTLPGIEGSLMGLWNPISDPGYAVSAPRVQGVGHAQDCRNGRIVYRRHHRRVGIMQPTGGESYPRGSAIECL